ncbi:hypothetical protein L7E55_00135 [Pelotomaculum isophthalicicum JI]|uniref:Uncharacterized protein n=1 Tax=Pelotomaculum isophthalicicum JI TaxID=947010 RepID=A0A9X4H4H3_9FIRM|nr:hypothetical protein [Pelotomaculum isophthalicicum]MDF9406779.1 hypothetical protein [Pelotomaculum isophthalicicum JI]
MHGKNLKLFTITMIVIILFLQAFVLILIYSPEYLYMAALNYILRPGREQIALPGGEAVQGKTGLPAGATGPADPAAFPEIAAATEWPAFTAQAGNSSFEPAQYYEYCRIVSKYQAEFILLQGEYEQKLGELVNSALQEYRQNGGKKNLSLLKMADKYIAAGRSQEKECDQRFDSTLAAMEAELQACNLPLDITTKIRDSYIARKNAQRRQLMAKAMAQMRGAL